MVLGIIVGFIILWLLIRWEVKRSVLKILSELYDKGFIAMDKEKYNEWIRSKRKKL